MGWQLFPSGIGWRDFPWTTDRGRFDCPNPRCKSQLDGSQAEYRLRTTRNWITVFFIPLIPLNSTGAHVKCSRCKSLLPVHVLKTETKGRPTEAVTEAEVGAPAAHAVEGVVVPEAEQAIAAIPAPLGVPPMPLASDHIVVASQEARTPSPPVMVEVLAEGESHALVPGARLVLGRGPRVAVGESAVKLRDSSGFASKTHAAIGRRSGGAVYVDDLGSTNGTYLLVGADMVGVDGETEIDFERVDGVLIGGVEVTLRWAEGR